MRSRNLHGAIMNLSHGKPEATHDYRVGHRDARHAAAELAIGVESERDRLLAAALALEAECWLDAEPSDSESLAQAKTKMRDALMHIRAQAKEDGLAG